jgi:hypothetical protein
MARDTKKNAKKRRVKAVVLDPQNEKWKQMVDSLPPRQGLSLYDNDVDHANRKFWHWKRVWKKYYCPTGNAMESGTEQRLVNHQVAQLFGPKSKFRMYIGFECVPVCTNDPSNPLLTHSDPTLITTGFRQDLARLHLVNRKDLTRLHIVRRTG